MKKTPLDAGFVARAAAGIRYAFTGRDSWFGAGEPMQPVAPPEVKGRQFDYDPYINVNATKPQQSDAITFDDLRQLADGYDVLRMVIEKRKDQLERLDWTIQRRDLASTGVNEAQIKDRRVDEAISFFRNPDKQSSWSDWLRALLEDLFVIDAPTIYLRKTLGGGLYALELIDGATIKRVIDDTGRTPVAPAPAYQQVLRGLPAVDYTADELIYRPRNRRTHRVYGFSPVEQILTTVNIALRRQSHQLSYYSAGSVPDALAGVPESWSVDDINRFQAYWDTLIAGESSERRKLRFIPGELSRNFKETKQPPLKDQYDEWLARVVCFCFSIEPTPFVAQVNRATAETSREQSLSDGVEPLKRWVKGIVDDVLNRYMNMADFEFVWSDETALSAKEQAEIFATYVGAGVLTVNEVRAELGRDPLPESPAPMEEEQDEPFEEADKLGKAKRPMTEAEATGLIEAFLVGRVWGMSEQVITLLDGIDINVNADDWQAELDRAANVVVKSINFDDWTALPDIVAPIIHDVAAAAGVKALLQVLPNPPIGMETGIRSRAAIWADYRAAEMVGMRRVDGKLIQNPLAKWQITEGTRSMIRGSVKEAIENGDSVQELARRLRESHAFGESRAKLIAHTEMARADGMGSYIGWSETGLVAGKEWLTAADDLVSDICRENGSAGVIALHEHFPSGDLVQPGHPECRCSVAPVLIEDFNKEQSND